MATQQTFMEPIAIVGSGCRFPGSVNSPSSLWKLLSSPRKVSKEISETNRFDSTGYYHPDGSHHGTSNVRHSYLLDDNLLREFDAGFFNISPNEADSIDPQQRLLLETVYEALESGGHTIDSLRGSDTSVYVGTMGVDWNDLLLRDTNSLPTYSATSTSRAIISNRISYFFDWHGPSMTIDTACSSSLIAVHQGVLALRTGGSRVAVACGTQVILGPETYIFESKMNMLSPTGRSRMWDADADGYARGEGVAAVVLKRLSDALADGDHIECLIRGTGTNQDGHSGGLTVPSTEAQASLIRKAYADAGLDPVNNPQDRPQFFEAHGTGTKAGDPREAAAIHDCFGGRTDTPLYVGSVKTVIGHLEGAAGLAGLLKASGMIQNATIPPNLSFNRLNPAIEPFYHGLEVPVREKPWPRLAEGVPRRVSVNSFGFGGSNAHAILEQYSKKDTNLPEASDEDVPLTPFVFSAASEASLSSLLQAYSNNLTSRDDISSQSLAWTLHSRRSQFSVRTAFPGSSIGQLVANIDAKLAEANQNGTAGIGIRSKPATPHLLGVFTGQGAQWPAMAAHLIRSSSFVANRVRELEDSLATLPSADRPRWRLVDEMLAGTDTSRIGEAELSQPLCTAVQIILLDLLRAAGITFKAVLGHSSGEIAAAYAADYISAHDAIRIAYYRGMYSVRLAGNTSNGQKGAMLAVGASFEDAQDMVNLEMFKGRLQVAAHNSSASVTLSGDADAIDQVKKVYDDKKVFARLLKVDTAYHSHHMLPCGDPYVQSLHDCGIRMNQTRKPDASTWFSSVLNGRAIVPTDAEILRGTYWRDNMTSPVLFVDAIKSAVASDPSFALALEVGPHPALKGPATQNISEIRTTALPYFGLLSRGQNDVTAFSDALGSLWKILGSPSVDLGSLFMAVCARTCPPDVVVDLPSYKWNHERIHWHESRRSHAIRKRNQPFHEVLGTPSPDSTEQDRRWTNMLKISEVPWIEGHQLQGQPVFPAAGYVTMAFEAAGKIAAGRTVELLELVDLSIPRAITFDDNSSAVETLVTLTAITAQGTSVTTADFSCYSSSAPGSESELELMASAKVKISFGVPDPAALISAMLDDSNMSSVEEDRFYSCLQDLGYGYSGPFRGLSSLKRRFNQASGLVSSYVYSDEDTSSYMIHPTTLDVAFQAAMLAFSAPGDERLWSLHVPTSIRSLRINPELLASQSAFSATQLPLSALMNDDDEGGLSSLCANIDLYSPDGEQTLIQVEDLAIKPFAPAMAEDDGRLLTYTKWDLATPNGPRVTQDIHPSAYEIKLAALCERLSYYYIRKWKSEITEQEWADAQEHYRSLRDFMEHTLTTVVSGEHPCVKKEWKDDTLDDIKVLIDREGAAGSIDIRILSAVGENIPAAVRGQTTILEHMLRDNMLDDFYEKGLGFERYNAFLARMMKQVIFRHPHAKILEIGAGTGGATKSVLESVGKSISSYTYTDVSVGFFDKAAQLFQAYQDKMTFKKFDVEKSPETQGFEDHSYDIVVASNVLHATASLQRTLEHTRQLLKPGGYLMLLELLNCGPIRVTNIMCGLSGWWIGAEDGRKLAPTITTRGWHTALRKAGFSGVDATTPDINTLPWPMSIMASQAVDERVNFLRRPLSSMPSSLSALGHLEKIVILGGRNLETARVADELAEMLENFCDRTTVLDDLPTDTDMADLNLSPNSTAFINLVDLDSPIFKNVTVEKMNGLKLLFELAKNVLWITMGAEADEPYHMASVHFSRVVSHEAKHVNLHHLDVSDLRSGGISRVIVEQFLRQCALDEWKSEAPDYHCLWSSEPEMSLDQGELKIPRIVPNPGQTSRLNSSRCAITKAIQMAESNVSLVASQIGSRYSINTVEEVLPMAAEHGEQCQVRIQESTLMALNINVETFLYLGIGEAVDGASPKRPVISLSTTNSSLINPVARIPVERENCAGTLMAVANGLVARSIIRTLPPGSSLLVHCSSKHHFLAEALKRQAPSKSICIIFVSSTESPDVGDSSWMRLDARAPRHVVRRALGPARLTHFIDFNADGGNLSTNIYQVMSQTGSKQVGTSAIYQFQASMLPGEREAVSEILESAVAEATTQDLGRNHNDLLVPLDEISRRALSLADYSVTTMVSWPLDGQVMVQIRPLDAKRLFSHDKTYLLVGLTGQLGQSLCEWMIRNGAGCVVLTSRHPKIDEKWLESLQGPRSKVRIVAMDVLDKPSLEKVIKEIKSTCPPIGGVANGAMVLHDTLFTGMSLDEMQKVLRPKIEGSQNLDVAFYDDELDFFVLFSSLACVIGNSGQSNYAAANGYLNSLARQRRKRGLAASTVDIGRVAGLGYVESANQIVVDQLDRVGLMAICESDFHQIFAETIRAGYPDSKEDAVLTTGIRMIHDDENIQGPWFEDPRFAHCVIKSTGANSNAQQADKKTSVPVARQLADAADNEEALKILQDCFSARLSSILQVDSKDVDFEAPLVELGVDSLVAVDVRSWFLKELKVDMPVLKVIGGSSLAAICQTAVAKLPEDITSSFGNASAGAANTNLAAPKAHDGDSARLKLPERPRPSRQASSIRSVSPAQSGSVVDNSDASSATEISTRSPSPDNLMDVQKPNARASKVVKSEQLSFAQSRFWFLRLLLQDQATFNVTFYYRVNGHLRIADLERAVRAITIRHEALRTGFVADPDPSGAGLAFQKVFDRSQMQLEHKRINSVEEVNAEYLKLKNYVFDIACGDVMRIMVLTLGPTSHFLLISYHHILMDGFGFQVFLKDLEMAYSGQSSALGAPPRQFTDVSRSQREAYEKGEMGDELRFWKGVFPEKAPPILPLLPFARVSSRVPMTTFDVHQVQCHLDAGLVGRVKAAARAQRSTAFHFYLAVFKAMLFLFTDAQILNIGIADANRNDDDVLGTIGLFLNLLTLRFQRQPAQRFSDAVAEARDTAYAALGQSRLPFDVLLKELNLPRSSTYSPFFQAFFDYRQGAQEKHGFGNVEFEVQELHPGRTAYDITLDVTDSSAGTLVMFRAQKCLYDSAGANLLLATYTHLLDLLSRDVSVPLNATPLFGRKQLESAIEVGRGPSLTSDWPETLPLRIDRVSEQNGDQIALMDGFDNTLTYAQMGRRIDAIGEALQRSGKAGPGSRVLVFEKAAADWVCSMLAIMRIGAIYVPLDLRNPLPRLAAVAADCRPTAILADESTIGDIAQLDAAYAAAIDISKLPSKPLEGAVANVSRAGSTAAILYTSGSTGLPKGIEVTHAGLRNEIEGYTKRWGHGAERALQQSAFTFNHSSDQIYTGLVNGGMVYVVPWSKRGDPLQIADIIQRHGITYTKATPSEYSLWMQYGSDSLALAKDWRLAFGGGERLAEPVVREFGKLGLPDLRFFNSYGPTEISISSHKMEIPYKEFDARAPEEGGAGGQIPCGYSLPNYTTYILDDQLKPVPTGMPGEIVIGGAGVSRGYLNNEALTAKHFVDDPYASPEYKANGWTRMYRTGDVAHLQNDGAMVFHRRAAGTSQVKIRGLRIELADIESNIVATSQGLLQNAVVSLRQGDPDFLVAHVVFASPEGEAVTDKHAFLEQLLGRIPLPQYMIPAAAIALDRLPLNNHSKVDRKAIGSLPLPKRQSKSTAETDEELSGMSETMVELRRVWRDVLGNKELEVEILPSTNFFLVGGNSLLAIRLQSRIRQVFNVVIQLVDILGTNTLGDMARKIEESEMIDEIDWDQETCPPLIPMNGYIPDNKGDGTRKEASGRKTVVVTGATGFVAKQLLPKLAASGDVGMIHCVAIRNKPVDPNRPRGLPIASGPEVEVTSHPGDLSAPMLGLSEEVFARLSREADVIVHLGGVHSFWDNYHALRSVNVLGTAELVRLAGPRRVPIHYISSGGVVPGVGEGSGGVEGAIAAAAASVAAHPPPTDGSNGYVASRWASEQILERASRELGIPATVHRFVRSSDAAPATAATLREFSEFVNLSKHMPDFSGWSGRMDLIETKKAASWLSEAIIATEGADAETGGVANCRFRHCEIPIAVEVAVLQQFLEKEKEGGAECDARMPIVKWVGRIKALGFGYLVAGQDVVVEEVGATRRRAQFQSRR